MPDATRWSAASSGPMASAASTAARPESSWIAHRLPAWGYTHRTVCRAAGEFARDDDWEGFCEVHVDKLEEFRLLLRSWLRLHRGARRRNGRCTSGSSSSCTTYGGEARPSSLLWSDCSSSHPPETPAEPQTHDSRVRQGLNAETARLTGGSGKKRGRVGRTGGWPACRRRRGRRWGRCPGGRG